MSADAITDKVPFSVHGFPVYDIVRQRQIESESAIEPWLEREVARLPVEREQRDIYTTGRRKPARWEPVTETVRVDADIRCDRLVKQRIHVFVIATSKQASKLILLASKTIHNDNYQIIQILCDAEWRGW